MAIPNLTLSCWLFEKASRLAKVSLNHPLYRLNICLKMSIDVARFIVLGKPAESISRIDVKAPVYISQSSSTQISQSRQRKTEAWRTNHLDRCQFINNK